MSSKRAKKSPAEIWVAKSDELRRMFPHVYSVLSNSEDFIDLRLKARTDGTVLSVLKQYGDDGAPVVAFGTGYDVVASLMGLDMSVQGGNWRVDKPWDPSSKG